MSVVPPTSSSAAIPVAGKQSVPGLPGSVASDSRYRVIGEIGRGGMGVVYEAVHCETGERVAIKTLASRREGLLRFKNEYRLASRLTHPNLVSLYDLVIADECSYFVMELAQGVDLRHYVRTKSGCNLPRLYAACAQILDALECLATRRHRPPRSQAVEHHGVRSRPREDPRLRARRRRRHARLLRRHARRHADVHEPGADRRPPARRAQRSLRARRGRLRDDLRRAAVRRAAAPGAQRAALSAPASAVGSRRGRAARSRAVGAASSWPSVPRSASPRRAPRVRRSKSAARRRRRRATARASGARTSSPRSPTAASSGAPPSAACSSSCSSARASGACHMALISGESGIGKSALAEAMLDEARDAGCIVLRGACREHEAVTYNAFDQVVDGAADAARARRAKGRAAEERSSPTPSATTWRCWRACSRCCAS